MHITLLHKTLKRAFVSSIALYNCIFNNSEFSPGHYVSYDVILGNRNILQRKDTSAQKTDSVYALGGSLTRRLLLLLQLPPLHRPPTIPEFPDPLPITTLVVCAAFLRPYVD